MNKHVYHYFLTPVYEMLHTVIRFTHTCVTPRARKLQVAYLCLQLRCLVPDLLYWNLDSASRILRWYFFIFTHDRPAASNVHQTVIRTLSITHQLQITIPEEQHI
jgi:hypothetical protein